MFGALHIVRIKDLSFIILAGPVAQIVSDHPYSQLRLFILSMALFPKYSKWLKKYLTELQSPSPINARDNEYSMLNTNRAEGPKP